MTYYICSVELVICRYFSLCTCILSIWFILLTKDFIKFIFKSIKIQHYHIRNRRNIFPDEIVCLVVHLVSEENNV